MELAEKYVFTESAPRPIQSISCDARGGVIAPSVGDRNHEGLILLVEEHIAQIVKLRTPFFYKELVKPWLSYKQFHV